MRSSQPEVNAAVPATVAASIVRSISGVCSECGTTYSVEPKGGNETWSCPYCGPSAPIVVREAPPARLRRRARRLLPRIRIPFVLVQILVILLTFTIFLGSVMFYMNGQTPARRQLARQARAQQEEAAATLGPLVPRDPGSQPQGQAAKGNPSDAADPDGAPSSTDVSPGQAAPAPAADQPDEGQPPVDGRDTVQRAAVETAVAETEASAETEAVAMALDDVPQSVAEDSLTVRGILYRSPRLFGKEVRLQCRFLSSHDDAVGKVPNRFDIDGQMVSLTESEEASFVRLEVMDGGGETLSTVFVSREGRVGQELQWTMPGDWVLVTGTPGVRYGDASGGTTWGLIVTKISAVQENAHDSNESETKKLAER